MPEKRPFLRLFTEAGPMTALAVVVGPPCWIVLGFACAVGLVMWSIHKIRRGPLMPPGSPSPGGKAA